MDYQSIINKYYPAGSALRDIYLKHCRAVADEAIYIALRKGLPIDTADIEAAAMLHDIGIYATDAPSIECHGSEPYIRHGIIGAELLRRECVSEYIASVAERHTGAGLTVDDIRTQKLPIPEADYCPVTILEKLICYADKFYSKSGSMQRKSLDDVRRSMNKLGIATGKRFEDLHNIFG